MEEGVEPRRHEGHDVCAQYVPRLQEPFTTATTSAVSQPVEEESGEDAQRQPRGTRRLQCRRQHSHSQGHSTRHPFLTARLQSQAGCNKGVGALLVRFDGFSSEEEKRTANPEPLISDALPRDEVRESVQESALLTRLLSR